MAVEGFLRAFEEDNGVQVIFLNETSLKKYFTKINKNNDTEIDKDEIM